MYGFYGISYNSYVTVSLHTCIAVEKQNFVPPVLSRSMSFTARLFHLYLPQLFQQHAGYFQGLKALSACDKRVGTVCCSIKHVIMLPDKLLIADIAETANAIARFPAGVHLQ